MTQDQYEEWINSIPIESFKQRHGFDRFVVGFSFASGRLNVASAKRQKTGVLMRFGVTGLSSQINSLHELENFIGRAAYELSLRHRYYDSAKAREATEKMAGQP